MMVTRDQPYTIDSFFITTTPTGRHTVRWTHNKRAIETFTGYNSEKRAKGFVKWLVKQLNSEQS